MSFVSPLAQTATSEPKTANGTAVMTASGMSQRSYCAARIKNTKIIPKINAVEPVPCELTS